MGYLASMVFGIAAGFYYVSIPLGFMIGAGLFMLIAAVDRIIDFTADLNEHD